MCPMSARLTMHAVYLSMSLKVKCNMTLHSVCMVSNYLHLLKCWLSSLAVSYQVYVYTGHLEDAETDSSVYLCIYGERGDSGLRLLHKSDKVVKFQRGMVSLLKRISILPFQIN